MKKPCSHAAGSVVAGRRVILVAARNFTRGMAIAIQAGQIIWEPPLEILAQLDRGDLMV